jgi:hypothetical protein
MPSHHPLSSALATACTLLTCATSGHAAPVLYSEATATLSYHVVASDGVDAVTNSRSDTAANPSNANTLARVRGCVNKGPGEPPCEALPGGGPNWWNSPASGLESGTGAQAQSDYGVNKARLHTGKDGCAESPGCGANLPVGEGIQRSATARSLYREEFKYEGAVQIPITLEFLLHGSWSGNGRLSFAVGNVVEFNSEDGGFAPVWGGVVFQSCNAFEPCVDSYDAIRDTYIYALPGNAADPSSGSVDQLVSWTTWVTPPELDGNGQFDHYWGFESILDVAGYLNGADVDAYNTVTLQRILIPQGESLQSVSGTAYNVQVVGGGTGTNVPEPPVSWLLFGAALAMGLTRWRASKD